jgi:hypothetical protein
MREQPRVDRLARNPRLEVVSGEGRSLELLLEVAGAQLVPAVLGMSPHSSQAVSLQLDLHRARVPATGVLFIGGANAPVDAEQLLDMVPELVTDDVRLREGPQPDVAREQPKEAQVEVDRAVSAAVERTYVSPNSTG